MSYFILSATAVATATSKAATTTAKVATTTAKPVTTTVKATTTAKVTTTTAKATTTTAKATTTTAKETGLTDRQIKAADGNEDGELSVDDVQNILIYYVNNTVAGKELTWEQLLGKQPQAQPRPGLLTLHEDIWIDADRLIPDAETS